MAQSTSMLRRIYLFYFNGFRQMTWGRTLWLIILVKLAVMFLVLKIFFFPDFLDSYSSDEEKSEYVSGELIDRQNK